MIPKSRNRFSEAIMPKQTDRSEPALSDHGGAAEQGESFLKLNRPTQL
jgi:hypothetical protein